MHPALIIAVDSPSLDPDSGSEPYVYNTHVYVYNKWTTVTP